VWLLIERWLARIQTAQWIVLTVPSLASSAAMAWWVRATGGNWLGMALAAIGGLAVVFLLIAVAISVISWVRRKSRAGVSLPDVVPMHMVVARVAARIPNKDASKFWPGARLAIRQAALNGEIQIYGHQSEDTGNSNATSWSLVSTPVPRDYWELAEITEIATSPEHGEELLHQTRPHRLSDGRFTLQKIAYYAKLTANWAK
jgi:hypothetical protein